MLFGSRPRATLPGHPQEWGVRGLGNVLSTLNPQKTGDRETVQKYLRSLESAIRLECRAPRYPNLQDVLREQDPGQLPVQLQLYRELHGYLRIWLN